MRWQEPGEGEFRTISRFLLFPRTIQSETRWLEKARIRQQLEHKCDGQGHWLEWVDLYWMRPRSFG